ncbi:hypothetical protein HK405_002281, partial [Cladochytrium tenue]
MVADALVQNTAVCFSGLAPLAFSQADDGLDPAHRTRSDAVRSTVVDFVSLWRLLDGLSCGYVCTGTDTHTTAAAAAAPALPRFSAAVTARLLSDLVFGAIKRDLLGRNNNASLIALMVLRDILRVTACPPTAASLRHLACSTPVVSHVLRRCCLVSTSDHYVFHALALLAEAVEKRWDGDGSLAASLVFVPDS